MKVSGYSYSGRNQPLAIMRCVWVLVFTMLGASAQSQNSCELASTDCICWPNNIHSYCGSGSCAPNDWDYTCRTGSLLQPDHVLPDEWELMMDSFDYENLIEGSNPAWVRRDVDGDDRQFIHRGGICQFSLRACTYNYGPQNNWVFSQHIKYPPGSVTVGTTEIFLNITFTFSSCHANPACSNDFVTLYRFDTNGLVSSASEQTNLANYVPLFGPGTEATDSRLQQSGRLDINVVRSFQTPGTPYTGFYLGIRDTGTCGNVRRILLYYTPCKARQEGLVNYPELVRPPAGSTYPNTAEACCATNSHSTTSRSVRAFSDGRCDFAVTCECDAGYELSDDGTACIPCPAGTYRSLTDPQGECLSCPLNTVTDTVKASACPCLDGYFRFVPLQVGLSCDAPPTAVRDLRLGTAGRMSVSISWTKPEVTGRNDFYYVVEFKESDNLGNFQPANPSQVQYSTSSTTVTYQIPQSGGTPLIPYTGYTIRVTVHNGVSDQDSGNQALRRTEIQLRTLEGVPSEPVNVQPLAGVIVWGSPDQPNGVITGYDIRFTDSTRSNLPISQVATSSYYLVQGSNIANLNSGTTMVQVRAKTSTGNGAWSSPQPYTEGSCPPVECPSVTTSPPCPTLTPCPVTPTPTECPSVTTMVTTDCPTCTCTTPTECPQVTTVAPTDCPPLVSSPGLKFMLRGKTYLNNTIVLISDIGEDDDALLCVTDKSDCCSAPDGEFYYPDNSLVPVRSAERSLYRNRGPQVVRLNRRYNDLSSTGQYKCVVPDSSGRSQSIYINIIASGPDSCPPITSTPCPTVCICPEVTTMPPNCTPCPTCSTREPMVCPTQEPCPTTTDCPTVTPPTCHPTAVTVTCPDCPPTPCPPTVTCSPPTCPPMVTPTTAEPLTCSPPTCLPMVTPTTAEPRDGNCSVTIIVSGRFIFFQLEGCTRVIEIAATPTYALDVSINSQAKRRKRQADSDLVIVTLQVSPKLKLVKIPSKFLSEGTQYTIQAQLVVNGTKVGSPSLPRTLTYTASRSASISEIFGRVSEGFVNASFLAIAIIVTFLLTAIIIALLVTVLACLYITCKVKSGYYSINKKSSSTYGATRGKF